jgi:hypothetical protein
MLASGFGVAAEEGVTEGVVVRVVLVVTGEMEMGWIEFASVDASSS